MPTTRGQPGAAGPGAAFGGGARPARSRPRRGAGGGLAGSQPLFAQETEKLPRRGGSAARDSFPLSLSQPFPSGSSGSAERAPEPSSNHNPGKYRRHRRRAPSRSAQQSLGGTGGRGRGGEGESLAPPTEAAVFSISALGSAPIASPTANGSKPRGAGDAEIRHGGAVRCPGGGVPRGLHSTLCWLEAHRWTHRERRSCILVSAGSLEVSLSGPSTVVTGTPRLSYVDRNEITK